MSKEYKFLNIKYLQINMRITITQLKIILLKYKAIQRSRFQIYCKKFISTFATYFCDPQSSAIRMGINK